MIVENYTMDIVGTLQGIAQKIMANDDSQVEYSLKESGRSIIDFYAESNDQTIMIFSIYTFNKFVWVNRNEIKTVGGNPVIFSTRTEIERIQKFLRDNLDTVALGALYYY